MPDWRKEIERLLTGLNLEPEREAEIIEELSQHLNDKYEELLAGGETPEQAFGAAIEHLNGSKLVAELRPVLKPATPEIVPGEPRHGSRIAEIWQNVRYAARLLRLNPGFATVAILSLALGIGANTAIFQLLNAVRLRTLPVNNPHELANVKVAKSPHGRTGRFSGPNPQLTQQLWENVRDEQQAFSSIGAWYLQRLNLSPGGEARYAEAIFVSGRFFDTLGVQPVLGRLISPSDDHRGCGSSAAVISHSYWQREFGGNPSVLGRKITASRQPFEIIGVTPSYFYGVEVGRNFDLALPLCAEKIINGEDALTDNPQGWWLAAIGRLKTGWTIDRATAQLAAISSGIFETTTPAEYSAIDKKHYKELKFEAVPAATGFSSLREEYQNPLWLLLAISGLVLLIACANLANLMVARASDRQREMAVRLALGASRARLIRQMLAESLLLAAIGTLFGAALAQALTRILVSFLSTERTRLFLDLQPDWRVLLFTTGLAILTCIVFGLIPAIQASRTPPGEVMKASGRSTTADRSRFSFRQLLVVSQVALSLVLLVGALLFARTLRNLLTLNAGFQQDRILVSNFDLSPLNLPVEQRIAYKHQLLERIRALPGVQSAANVFIVPLSGSGWNEPISIEDTSQQRQVANFNEVSSAYFQTVGTQILAGRDFNSRDTHGSPLVAVVTEMFAKKFFNNKNPIGSSFAIAQPEGKPDRVYQIVGLVKDAKYFELREEFAPIVFIADTQSEQPDQEAQIVIRSNESLSLLMSAVQNLSAEMHPAIVINFRPFRNLIREGLIRERLMATLSGFFGLLAAILAMIGLYGVVSYMVARRRNEIGIRMALGAQPQSILSMMMREAVTLLIAGLAIGLLLALVAGRTAQALLFGMQPSDPLTLLMATAALAAVAVAASFLPAQRAATVNPMQALREE